MTLCARCKCEIQETDVAVSIRAMKERSGTTTDAELALFMGRERSAVAMWRHRGSIPEKAELQFARLMRKLAA